MLTIGTKVKGTTTRGRQLLGTLTNIKQGKKGAWLEVTQEDGKVYSTRASLLEIAQ